MIGKYGENSNASTQWGTFNFTRHWEGGLKPHTGSGNGSMMKNKTASRGKKERGQSIFAVGTAKTRSKKTYVKLWTGEEEPSGKKTSISSRRDCNKCKTEMFRHKPVQGTK